MLTVLLGGARSGKSSLAVRLAGDADDVVYVATSPRIDGDTELSARIDAHVAERPPHWRTIETEIDLAGALAAAGEAFAIVDCLALWVNNVLHHGGDEAAVLNASSDALRLAADRNGRTVVVTNEVGLGLVPEHELARTYRDLLGRVNQQWVAAADRAWFLVAGRALALHDVPDPGEVT